MSYTLHIINTDNDVIFEKEISADDVISLLLEKKEETEDEPVRQKKTKKKYKKRKTIASLSDEDDALEPDMDEDDRPAGGRKRVMPEDIIQMKNRIREGVSVSDIAREFGITSQTVYVLKRKMEDGIM